MGFGERRIKKNGPKEVNFVCVRVVVRKSSFPPLATHRFLKKNIYIKL
jgi:hypothetical protein